MVDLRRSRSCGWRGRAAALALAGIASAASARGMTSAAGLHVLTPDARADTSSPAAVASAAVAPAAPDTTVTTIILVRHAEKDTVLLGPDPPLRAEGMLRAHALVHAVGEAGVAAIYVTPWLRNRQTAMPLATALGESLRVVDDVGETVRRLRGSHWGQTVLVIGHSNTIPNLIAQLTGRAFPTPDQVPYDGMWVVTLARDGRAALVALRYGAPEPTRPEHLPSRPR